MTLISLGTLISSGVMVEASESDEPRFGMTEDSCTTVSLEPKANKLERFANLLRSKTIAFLPLISHWLESLGVKMAFLPLFVDFVVFVVAEISYGLKLDLVACFIFSAL